MIFLQILIYTRILQLFYSQPNFLHKCLILLTITNNSISKKQHPKYSIFISTASIKHPSNNKGQLIVVFSIGILL